MCRRNKMLEIFTKDGWRPISNRQNYHTVYDYDGTQSLAFDISTDDEMYQYVSNETPIRNSENRYLIKDINKRKSNCTVTCDLDMDDWLQNEPYLNTKDVEKFKTKTLGEILGAIKPSGWTIVNTGIRSYRRTLEMENASNYDVLMKCQEIFEVTYEINNLDRQITVIDPDQVLDKGIYITPQLNLEGMTMQGTSKGFATRITAYGKQNEDGSFVNFAAINNGKNYVEDNTYANKEHPIWAVWKDERYILPENLLADAKKKLKEQAYPILSFDVTVNDLAESDDRYSFLKMGLYDFAHVIVDSDTEIIERVIKLQKYHDAPDKNKITLSSKPETVISKINNTVSVISESLTVMKGSILEQAQKKATQLIQTWAEKGHVYLTENEIYILDQLPKEKAKYCIRINLGGIGFSSSGWQGPYLSAWTIDGAFNADFITGGTIRGIELIGNTIKGGKITGETTIEVGTDLYVGNNIYLGDQKTDLVKAICFNKDTELILSDNAAMLISKNGDSESLISVNGYGEHPRVSITAMNRADSSSFSDILLFDNMLIIYIEGEGVATFYGISISFTRPVYAEKDLVVEGDFSVWGSKNRVISTDHYGMRKLNAVESAECYFTDEGQISLDDHGRASINFDPIWLETVNTEKPYHVQLTPYCEVCPWIVEEYPDHFVIAGKPNTKVNWHISALQKDFENVRLEELKKEGEQNGHHSNTD